MKSLIFDIQRFCVYDGPGIRTTVFLKGCPLHCPWCANPESQSAAAQLLWFSNKCTACGGCLTACGQGARSGRPGEKPRLDRAKCIACGACAAECPVNAISEGDGKYVIDADLCTECGSCASTCPVGAPKAE